ncbi:MAG: histidine kinase, partial [Proteobacteria bacterium]|nr:histidine kinase [Pseudomonadota bacterium]
WFKLITRMVYRYSHIRLIKLAGIIIWLSLSAPLILQFDELNKNFIIYLSSHISFGIGFWLITNNIGRSQNIVKSGAFLLVLVSIIFVINYVTESAIGFIYSLIISVLIAWLFTIRQCLLILLVFNLLLALQFKYLNSGLEDTMVQYVLIFVYLGFSVFSFIISLVAYRQQNAKEELRMLNTELKATQVLLADSSSINERLRISRELHDLIGHHLTALTLNLEAASHMTSGKPQTYVKKAHSIARLLLSDVREVVSKFRQSGTLDVGLAVRELLEGIPGLKVTPQIPTDFLVEDPQLAQTILRCAQEMITNTMKHAQASRLWVKLERSHNSVILEIKDNGIGLKKSGIGNGITGINERVKQLNGTTEFISENGLSVKLTFPV